MEKLYIIYFLFINCININCLLMRKNIAHPIKIKYDFSNFLKTDETRYLEDLLKEGKKIIKNLVFCNNERKLNINEKVMSKCYRTYKFISISNFAADIIIFPVFKNFPKNYSKMNFLGDICIQFNQIKIQPSVCILYINEKFDIKAIINNSTSRYITLLEILRSLTECLGLSQKFMNDKSNPKNNFFEIPLYLLSYSSSYESIKKLYRLSKKPIPPINISLYGNFYNSSWDNNSIVQDFKNENINIKGDISEVSMNLLNDMNYYKVAECDFQYFYKNKCYRVDQKCISLKDFNLLYLNYGINSDKNNEIICYLSNSYNLEKNQCGIKYGHLLHNILDFCPLIKKFDIRNPKYKRYEIPELNYYKKQTLNLLVPSKKCKMPSPRTIYFKSEVRTEKEYKNIKLEKVTFNETQRKYFVTYLTGNDMYFNAFLDILNNNGLIRSFSITNDHNLIIKMFYEDDLRRNKIKLNDINKYQKIFHFIGNNEFFYKDKLYLNYLKMKKIFPTNYTYMPITYIYPRAKNLIEKIFKNYTFNLKNLWIVKPTKLFSGIGIHIFKSLEEEKAKQFLISQYLKNPHLINGKKYDLRVYVLVTGFKPLRIYLNKEGLVRIATNKYSLNNKTIDDKFVHLTNTAINKQNKKYIYPKNSDDYTANKWNFNTYKNYLKSKNFDYEQLFEKIKDIVIKTIISGQRKIINITNEFNIDDRSMFNLFGFDIFVDYKINPALLEVNTRPFMHIYDEMDKIVKTNLFVDTLNIVGLTPFSHQKEFKSFDKDSKDDKEEDKVEEAFCELTRPRGDYELIFPLKENINKYRILFLNDTSRENLLLWEKILNEE